jgi:hypothetical protein
MLGLSRPTGEKLRYRTEELCRGPTYLPRVKYRALGKEYKQDLGKASAPQTAHVRRHLCREPAVSLSAKYFSLPRAPAKALGKFFFGFLLPIFVWSLATVLEAKI